MSKGTPSMGRRQKTTHIRCRRCGRNAYHKQGRLRLLRIRRFLQDARILLVQEDPPSQSVMRSVGQGQVLAPVG